MGRRFHSPSERSTPALAARFPRREFLARASGCFLCGAAGIAPARAATDRPIAIGTLADYPKDAISEKFIQHDIFVIRHRGRLYACTAICPHKANYLLLDPQDSGRIICSGHESKFTPEGRPTSGPARRALVRYGIAVKEQGRVFVDTSREFQPGQWDDAACFLVVS